MRVFASLIWLIVVVVMGLSMQVVWYLFQMCGVRADVPAAVSSRVLERDGQHNQTPPARPRRSRSPLRALERLGISRRSSQLTACIVHQLQQ